MRFGKTNPNTGTNIDSIVAVDFNITDICRHFVPKQLKCFTFNFHHGLIFTSMPNCWNRVLYIFQLENVHIAKPHTNPPLQKVSEGNFQRNKMFIYRINGRKPK